MAPVMPVLFIAERWRLISELQAQRHVAPGWYKCFTLHWIGNCTRFREIHANFHFMFYCKRGLFWRGTVEIMFSQGILPFCTIWSRLKYLCFFFKFNSICWMGIQLSGVLDYLGISFQLIIKMVLVFVTYFDKKWLTFSVDYLI